MNVSTKVDLFLVTSSAQSNKTEAAPNIKYFFFPLRAFLINLLRAIDHMWFFFIISILELYDTETGPWGRWLGSRALKQCVWLTDGCLVTGKAWKKDTMFVRTNTDLTVLHHISDSSLLTTQSKVSVHYGGHVLHHILMRAALYALWIFF